MAVVSPGRVILKHQKALGRMSEEASTLLLVPIKSPFGQTMSRKVNCFVNTVAPMSDLGQIMTFVLTFPQHYVFVFNS